MKQQRKPRPPDGVSNDESKERFFKKSQRIAGREALVETWEKFGNDRGYVRELKARLHSDKSQLQRMWT